MGETTTTNFEYYLGQLWFPRQQNHTIALIIEFGNHDNEQICIKVVFETYNDGGNRKIGFGKLFRRIWVSMALK